jgi:hypothetical protein
MEFDPADFMRRVCSCGPVPDVCLSDEVVLVQHAWDKRKFRNAPRERVETDVSLLAAADWTLTEVSTYIRRGRPPALADLKRAGLRRTTAGGLRRAGFVVIHTPGALVAGPHVSVTWPGAAPFERQDEYWPLGVAEKFDACFTGCQGE